MQALFFVAFGLMVYSYFIFPLFMAWCARYIHPKNPALPQPLPTVAIIMAAYNEAAVFERKIRSSFDTDYPKEKIVMYVGLDYSTDDSQKILETLSREFKNLQYIIFEKRTGKPQIINALIKNTRADVLIMTDADTFFDKNTISELIKPFADAKVGGVQGHLVSSSVGGGVAAQELMYNARELRTKQGEGTLGVVMGAHGACYALRNSLYVPVPVGFSVDDFFVIMQILKQNYKVTYAQNAVCSMGISGSDAVQFGRKRRMAAGNYQNLWYFYPMLLPHYGVRAWVFWSHKVVRWWGWLLMILMVFAAGWCAFINPNAEYLWLWAGVFGAQILFYSAGIIDYFLVKYININIGILRSVRHFIYMNYAMLRGFIDFLQQKTVDKWN